MPRGVLFSIDQAEKEVTLWHPALPGGVVSIRRTKWPKGKSEPHGAYDALFKYHSQPFAAKFPRAKFLGPAALFESKTLQFYGGSWRSPDRTMSSLVFTAVDERMFMITAVLPSAKGTHQEMEEARRALQRVFGGIERRSAP